VVEHRRGGYLPRMTEPLDLGRPVAGDVLDLISDDHRLFERLLAQLRDSTQDRDAVRKTFANVLIAHGEAEEELVYPVLRRKSDDVGKEEVEHGHEEHAEGNQALLEVLELSGTDTQAFDDAVEKLSNLVAHHIAEEEITILSPAREDVGDKVRADLGAKWAARRNELIDEDCGSADNVRRIVEEAEREGLLEDS
jgi:hemerythrin-like domain-containing protein